MTIDVDFLNELDRFRLLIKRRVHSQFHGERSTTIAGEGLVFREFSPYTIGDDIRAIDWKVYAKTEKLFVKRFENERSATLHILVDASSSMNFGKKITKFEYAAMIGLGFAYMAMRNNEKFEFTTFSDALKIIKPRHGETQLINLVDQLNKTKIGGKSKLKESLEQYKKYIHSKSLLVLISDFFYDANEIKEVLLNYKKSDIYIIQVLDPIERSLSLEGDVLLEDMENKISLRTFVSNRLKLEYENRLREHIMEVKNIAAQFRGKFLVVSTNETIFNTFYRILFKPD